MIISRMLVDWLEISFCLFFFFCFFLGGRGGGVPTQEHIS